jgi:hypothetical protein
MATSIRFQVREEAAAREEPQLHPLVSFEQLPANRIDVADDLPLADPRVLKTQRLLNKRQRASVGLIPAPAGGLHVRTSMSLHDRAALMTRVRETRLPVTTKPEGIRVLIPAEQLGFGVEELKQVEHAITYATKSWFISGLGSRSSFLNACVSAVVKH